jgi:exopolysaccharide production protein ExoZ
MSNELRSIQYLRAVAALMVVLVHYQAPLVRLGYQGWSPQAFGSGVDIFFVISGVVMWLSTAGRDLKPGDFLLKRVVRIVPMYILITLFIAIIMFAFPWAVNNGHFDGPHLAASLLFIPWEHPDLRGHLFPVFVPGWTINAEMFFYLLFSVALLFAVRLRVFAVALVLGVLVLTGAILRPTGPLSFYTEPYLLEFLFGLVIAAGYRTMARIGILPSALLVAGGLAGLVLSAVFESYVQDINRVVIWGIPAAMIVCGSMYLERGGVLRHSRIMHFLGNASYSIYMTHTIVLSACGFVLSRIPLSPVAQQLIYRPFAMAAVVTAGCLTYVLVEKPMTKGLRALTGRRQRRQQIA